jgi:uncharacterized protein
MKYADWNPLSLDVLAFAQSQAAVSGQWNLNDLPRLSELVVAQASQAHEGLVHWHLQGEMDPDSVPPTKPVAAGSAHSKSTSLAASLMAEADQARAPKVQRVLPSLHLSAQAQLMLQCQCCLGAVSVFVEAQRRFVFVNDEAEAELLDEEVPEDCDVLVLSHKLNTQELIEDELLLAQPLVPRHEVCPAPLIVLPGLELEAEEPEPHPFAVLAKLKGHKPS